MANVYATKSGFWSDTTVWNTAALPTVADDVYANNFIVYIDINTQVLSIRTRPAAGINAGGSFRINDNISLSADVIAGTTTCLTFASGFPFKCTVFGNASGSNTTAVYSIQNSSSGTFNLIGNTTGGIGSVNLVLQGSANTSSGIFNILGNVFGGSSLNGSSNNCNGAMNISTGTMNVTGSIYGSTINLGGTNSYGIGNTSTGFLNIRGDVIAGSYYANWGANNSGAGTMTIIGNVYGGGGNGESPGAVNGGSGVLTVVGFVSGGYGSGCPGVISRGYVSTCTVSGNVYGGRGSASHGLRTDTNITTVTIFGDVSGGTGSSANGVYNGGPSMIYINGSVAGNTGSLSYGASNNFTGVLTATRAIANAYGQVAFPTNSVPGIFGSQTGLTVIESLECGARGQWPTAGNVYVLPKSNSTATLVTSAYNRVDLITSLSANFVPPLSSVRKGVVYNDYTGTLEMPSVSSVAASVAVDNNNIGLAALTPQVIWSAPLTSALNNTIGERAKNIATQDIVVGILSAFS